MASFALLNSQVVIPALVQRLGGSNVAIGALPVIVYLCYFLPQLIAANYAQMEPFRRPWVLSAGIVQRSQVFLLAFAVALFGSEFPGLALVLFFLLYSVNQFVAGVAAPSWFDFVVKTTLPHQRGRLMGMRSSIGASLGLVNSLLLALFLTYLDFPWNYSAAFFLAFLYQISSWLVQRRVVEDQPSAIELPVPLSRLAARVRQILLSDARFRRFLLASAVSTVGLMPMGFFTVAALKRFALSESYVGFFTMTMLASQIVFAGLLGWLGDVKGHKATLMVCALAMVLASLLAVIGQHPGWFFAIFSLVGLIFGLELITRHNFAAECATDTTRPMYIGIMNAWLAPWFLSSLIGGWISDRFGYEIVFIVGAVFSLGGLLLLTGVADPRARLGSPSPA
ncbi:MAG: MFS transporter [Ignavibacteriales bacterium]|nr:MFS transporter [Ignavibacteriales bacterium]